MNRAEVAALVQDERVHRDLYLSEELFALEQKHFFANTWNYVGHASQVPNAGDYVTVELAGRPLVMVRGDDGAVRVLYNRCAHKGTQLVSDGAATPGNFFRCPYHAWTYGSTARRARCRCGRLRGHRPSRRASGRAAAAPAGSRAPSRLRVRQDRPGGPGFADYFGEALRSIDNLVDRSPRRQARGSRRRACAMSSAATGRCTSRTSTTRCIRCRPHESASGAAARLWQGQPADEPKPMAIEQILPFGAGYDFFDRMGGRVHAERAQRPRHAIQHPFRLRPGARVRGGDARRPRRRARRRDPAALAAERALLSEPGAEGLAAGDPRHPPARRRPHR